MIGVLALQGNYEKHIHILGQLGMTSTEVRYPRQLDNIEGLIIPGGESTSMSIQIDRTGFRKAIKKFSQIKSVLGTCAGMIMLSSNSKSNNLETLCLMDFYVERNGWGRQVNSFIDQLKLQFDRKKDFMGVFIRAPKITKLGNNLKVLATYNNEPVMMTDGKHYVCSFHPELGFDNRIHAYYLKQIHA